MGLFTNPVVLNDGTANRSFSFRAQKYDTKAVAGDYIEDAAAIAAESVLTVKHDSRSAVPRHLLQRTEKLVPSANTALGLLPITVNLTVTADKAFTVAEIQKELTLMIDALSEANFLTNFLSSKL